MHSSSPVLRQQWSLDNSNCWRPFDELIAELFYPSMDYIWQSNDTTCELATIIASTFFTEFQDTTKATSMSLMSIGGIRSVAKLTAKERKPTLEIKASTSISESVHASSIVGLVFSGTIHSDHVTAEDQSQSNSDFGCGHECLVTDIGKKGELSLKLLGSFHNLPTELQHSMIVFGKMKAPKAWKDLNEALK